MSYSRYAIADASITRRLSTSGVVRAGETVAMRPRDASLVAVRRRPHAFVRVPRGVTRKLHLGNPLRSHRSWTLAFVTPAMSSSTAAQSGGHCATDRLNGQAKPRTT